MTKELSTCKILKPGTTTWCYRCKVEKPLKGGSKKNGLFCCSDCKIKPKKTESKSNA